jgi:Dolichyl-phosphate-mannose-protein mannosyltransferase
MTSRSSTDGVRPATGKGESEWAWLFAVLAASLAVRLTIALTLGLSVDESYSTAVAQHFSLSYYDHPPMHLWLAGGITRLVGSQAGWIARLPFISLGLASTVLLYRLTCLSFGALSARWAVVAFALSPFFSVGASGWVLPDGPLVCAALAMTWCLRRALADDRWADWLLCGVSAGLGLLSKYLMVLPLLGCLLFVLRYHPRRLLTVKPWLALALASVCFAPVVIWNLEHHWASFAFQGGRAGFEGWHPGRAAALLAASLLYVSPWTAVIGLRSVGQVLRKDLDAEVWWFGALAWPGIGLFLIFSLWAHVLPHWAMIAWLYTLPLVGHSLAQWQRKTERSRWVRRWFQWSGGFLAVLLGFVLTDAQGLWDRWVPGFPLNDPLTEVVDWLPIRTAVDSVRREHPSAVLVVQSFVDAGKVDYAMGGGVPVLCLCDDPHHYGVMYPASAFEGREAIVLANARRKDWWARAQAHFESLSPPTRIEVRRNGRPAVQIEMTLGRGLSALPHEVRPAPAPQ